MVTSKVLPGDYFKDIFKPQPDSNKASTKIGTPNHSRSEPKDYKQQTKTPYKKSPSMRNSPILSEEKKAIQSPIHE
jgi:hypothetical protein